MSRPRGFTLLELLVAIALFAVVAALVWGSLEGLSRGSMQLREASERLAAVQRGVDLLVRDLRQAAPRPVRDGSGRELAALLGEPRQLEFTRAGHANALAQVRAELERVGYRRGEDGLERLRWTVLDRAGASQAQRETLFTGLQSLQILYRDASGREHGNWPPRGGDGALPRAVELRLVLDDYGELRRLVELPVATLP